MASGFGEKMYTSTLRQFIDEMKEGWGFHRPYRVSQVGQALASLFTEEDDLSKPVTVKFIKGNYGYGPSFHYTYAWEVEGVELPKAEALKAQPGAIEAVFGYQSNNLPEIDPTPEGFRCGYVW